MELDGRDGFFNEANCQQHLFSRVVICVVICNIKYIYIFYVPVTVFLFCRTPSVSVP